MKLLLTGAFNYTEKQLVELQDLGYDITFIQDEREEVSFDVSEFEAVVCNNLFLYNDISKFKKLKVIHLTSAGLDRVPLNYIKENRIQLYNAKNVYSVPMAEWVVLKILEIYKKSKVFWKNQENHTWKKERELFELTNKNIGIIGFGDVGIEVSKRLKAFGTNITAINRSKVDSKYIDKYVSLSELDNVLPEMDIVILTIASTPETQYLINKQQLNLMHNNAVLINVARGDLINQEELIKSLDDNKFLGVALDVFQEEPLKESPLWDYENVHITPHNSFVSEENQLRLFECMHNNLISITC